MQPYQQAAQSLRERDEEPFNVAGKIASKAGQYASNAATAASFAVPFVAPFRAAMAGMGAARAAMGAGGARAAGAMGAGAAGSNAMANGIAAFLNPHIPQNIAIAGISKINPRLGKFVNGAMDRGYDFDEVKEFLGDKLQNSMKNVVEQYSPELHKFIIELIQNGRSPLEAGAIAQLDKKKYGSAISQMKKDHKASWQDILKSSYGETSEAVQPSEITSPGKSQMGVTVGKPTTGTPDIMVTPQSRQRLAIPQMEEESKAPSTGLSDRKKIYRKNRRMSTKDEALNGILDSIEEWLGQ